MPRYFFHVSGFSSFTDTVGAEMPNDGVAWSTAVVSCGELLRDLAGKMPDHSEIQVTVRNEDERVVAVVRVAAEQRPSDRTAHEREAGSAFENVRERMIAEIDASLDWIKDIHDPEDYGPFASDLAEAALVSLEEGDHVGRDLVVRRETIQ